jgi:RNA polymerase sigma-70 factor (ECF subfamily)
MTARDGASADADQALERLWWAYCHPIHAFLRRNGHSPEAAQDLTQEFFARRLAGRLIELQMESAAGQDSP